MKETSKHRLYSIPMIIFIVGLIIYGFLTYPATPPLSIWDELLAYTIIGSFLIWVYSTLACVIKAIQLQKELDVLESTWVTTPEKIFYDIGYKYLRRICTGNINKVDYDLFKSGGGTEELFLATVKLELKPGTKEWFESRCIIGGFPDIKDWFDIPIGARTQVLSTRLVQTNQEELKKFN